LRELSSRVKSVHPGCLYYHFWGGLLRSGFDEPEYPNDFAAWSWRSLHDKRLAEQLARIDPSCYRDMEELRQELADVIDERLAESEFVPLARSGQRFTFIRSQIVVFDTGIRIAHPCEMVERIARMSLGSLFYHFIDARRRNSSSKSDFVEWFKTFEEGTCDELSRRINRIDPYFTTLVALRQELATVFQLCPFNEE